MFNSLAIQQYSKDSRKACGFQYTSLLIHFCNDYRPYSIYWQASSILFFIIIFISSFDFHLSKSLISRRRKKNLYITNHCASDLCLIQLDSISLAQKVDLHRLLDIICPSMISKIISSIFIYSIVGVSWLVYHLWIISLLVELHGIQKKLRVNDNKTKRQGKLNLVLEVLLSLQISIFRRI